MTDPKNTTAIYSAGCTVDLDDHHLDHEEDEMDDEEYEEGSFHKYAYLEDDIDTFCDDHPNGDQYGEEE